MSAAERLVTERLITSKRYKYKRRLFAESLEDLSTAAEKYAELEAAGLDRPLCDCHREPMLWNKRNDRAKGGWLCAVRKRKNNRHSAQMKSERNRPLRRVVLSSKRLSQAKEDHTEAIRDAVKAGESLRKVAKAAGLSHEQVRRIALGRTLKG